VGATKKKMLNRRHLRIKVLQQLYAYSQSENQNYGTSEKELMASIDKMDDLYILYLQLLPEIVRHHMLKIEDRKRRSRPTQEDLHPKMNFVNNQFIQKVNENFGLQQKINSLKMNWVGDLKQDILKKLLIHIEESEAFQNYLTIEEPSFDQDKDFSLKLFKTEVCNFPLLLNYFDDERVNWQDDYDHIFSMVLKSLKTISATSDENHILVMDLYKDDEEEYTRTLFRKSVMWYDEQTEMLGNYTKNWDAERLAKMDILIMNLAITEAKSFPSIPLKVTLNEYIEIAKFYSTPKSNTFINGVLDKIFEDLKKSGAIKKTGRGLIE
jgi:transcription antitermination protein NusB